LPQQGEANHPQHEPLVVAHQHAQRVCGRRRRDGGGGGRGGGGLVADLTHAQESGRLAQ